MLLNQAIAKWSAGMVAGVGVANLSSQVEGFAGTSLINKNQLLTRESVDIKLDLGAADRHAFLGGKLLYSMNNYPFGVELNYQRDTLKMKILNLKFDQLSLGKLTVSMHDYVGLEPFYYTKSNLRLGLGLAVTQATLDGELSLENKEMKYVIPMLTLGLWGKLNDICGIKGFFRYIPPIMTIRKRNEGIDNYTLTSPGLGNISVSDKHRDGYTIKPSYFSAGIAVDLSWNFF